MLTPIINVVGVIHGCERTEMYTPQLIWHKGCDEQQPSAETKAFEMRLGLIVPFKTQKTFQFHRALSHAIGQMFNTHSIYDGACYYKV